MTLGRMSSSLIVGTKVKKQPTFRLFFYVLHYPIPYIETIESCATFHGIPEILQKNAMPSEKQDKFPTAIVCTLKSS